MTSRLASLLVQENLVAPKAMADAFQRQVIYGGTLDSILLEMNALPEATLVAALGRSSGLPTADSLPQIDKLRDEHVLELVPAATAEKLRIVPHSIDGQTLRVMTIDPPDRRAIDQLAHELGRPVDALITPEHRFVHAMSLVYDVPVPARFQSLQARLAKRAGAAPTPTVTQPAAKLVSDLPKAYSSKPEVAAAERPVEKIEPPKDAPKVEPPKPQPIKVESKPEVPTPDAAIPTPHDDQLTPRLTLREPAAPARVTRELARVSSQRTDNIEPVPLLTAVKTIDEATDRDAIFEAMCCGARSIADFVALFTVHGDAMTGRAALADRWIDASSLAALALPLGSATPFRTAFQGHAPLLAPVGEDDASRALIEAMGRRAPLPAAIAPVLLRERVVAMLYADASGKRFSPSVIADLSSLTTAAARAFQRLILASKGRDYKAAPVEVQAKLANKEEPRGATVAPGGWRSADGDTMGRAPAVLHEAPTQRHVAVQLDDVQALFQSIERGDERARASTDQIIALGARGAEYAVMRLPGPVRIDRIGLRGPTPPLQDHGPLQALLARFGEVALPALEARLEDTNADVRYYTTLAVGQLGREVHVARLGKRLFDRDASVRKAAVDTLRRQAPTAERTTILEQLRGELPGPEKDRQRWAADALGVFGDAPSVPRLIELVKHDDESIRNTAHRALVNITKQDFGTSRWRWRGWWDRHKTESRVEWMFEGLVSSSDEIRSSSQQELKAQFPESFGYDWNAPKRERDEAKRKWLEWHLSRRG